MYTGVGPNQKVDLFYKPTTRLVNQTHVHSLVFLLIRNQISDLSPVLRRHSFLNLVLGQPCILNPVLGHKLAVHNVRLDEILPALYTLGLSTQQPRPVGVREPQHRTRRVTDCPRVHPRAAELAEPTFARLVQRLAATQPECRKLPRALLHEQVERAVQTARERGRVVSSVGSCAAGVADDRTQHRVGRAGIGSLLARNGDLLLGTALTIELDVGQTSRVPHTGLADDRATLRSNKLTFGKRTLFKVKVGRESPHETFLKLALIAVVCLLESSELGSDDGYPGQNE